MGIIRYLISLLLFTLLLGSANGLSPESIVVVANRNDDASVAIAQHYLEKRAIPKKNLLLLETSDQETITWDEFLQTIFNPLRQKLFAEGWLDGSLSNTRDREGRMKAVTLGAKIDFLVLCRLPLRIENDTERVENAPGEQSRKEFQVNRCSVDSELALLAAAETPTIGFVPNPLFAQKTPPSLLLQQVVKVARLDGPTVDAAQALVDHALEAEKKGLRGHAYIDLGGPHQRGDEWMRQAGEKLETLYYPVSWNRDPAAIGFKERFDAPAFYFGWWKLNIVGPMRERDFQFPPGAIGWHLHSFSANSVRRDNFRWTGPLIQRGITATVGNVYEPYLELTHHPHAFLEALADGMSTGEAAYYALPALSWMAVFIGDPLYQPFKTDLKAQLEAQEKERRPDALAQYVTLREMERLKQRLGSNPARLYGQKAFNRAPGLALGYGIAGIAQEQGRRQEAIDALAFAGKLPPIFDANQQGLAYLANARLWGLGARKDAFSLIKSLMSSPLPDTARRDYLPTAIQQARSLGELTELRTWTQQQQEFEQRDREREEAKK